ncbi:MAG: hypothetical protein H0T73_00990 [Ardenticatenales bacterium]|nr:hypothetical protein [Ardenticatenales bacterium]
MAENKPGDEYGFDKKRHDPLNKDEEQAEAAQYGIYGYESQPGDAYEGKPGSTTSIEGDPDPQTAHKEEDPAITPAGGGQSRRETEHGAGFGQPMEEPQRSASQNSRPEGEA